MYSINIRLYVFALLLFITLQLSGQPYDSSLWERDIRFFEHLDSVDNYSPDAILFAGSSSIRLWSTLAKDMAPYPVIQRGFGGAKWSDLAVYAERIFYPHPCRAIVLFVANDIVGNEDDKSPEEVRQLFNHTIEIIRKKFPDTPVLWITTTPTASRWAVWPRIVQANNRIIRECQQTENIYTVKTDSCFLNESGLPNPCLFMEDRLHLNANGYAVWTEIIKKEIDQVLGSMQ
jgi:hypothetical protein